MKILLILTGLVLGKIFNLDLSETLEIPVSGSVTFKISVDSVRATRWTPTRFEEKLEFENIDGEIVRSELGDYQLFTVYCKETCVAKEVFMFTLVKSGQGVSRGNNLHAVIARFYEEVREDL